MFPIIQSGNIRMIFEIKIYDQSFTKEMESDLSLTEYPPFRLIKPALNKVQMEFLLLSENYTCITGDLVFNSVQRESADFCKKLMLHYNKSKFNQALQH